jgi:predicted transposase YdaD
MFHDIFRESWVYQEIGQEFRKEGFEKGLERGLERMLEERERRVHGQRQVLASFVQAHFSDIADLARQRGDEIHDPDVLERLNLKLLAAQTVEEAKKILLEVDRH